MRFNWSDYGGVVPDGALVACIDEAGNTGSKHLDREQPYYVTGGWLLKQADVPRAESAVSRALIA
jgi:hypothetical protein